MVEEKFSTSWNARPLRMRHFRLRDRASFNLQSSIAWFFTRLVALPLGTRVPNFLEKNFHFSKCNFKCCDSSNFNFCKRVSSLLSPFFVRYSFLLFSWYIHSDCCSFFFLFLYHFIFLFFFDEGNLLYRLLASFESSLQKCCRYLLLRTKNQRIFIARLSLQAIANVVKQLSFISLLMMSFFRLVQSENILSALTILNFSCVLLAFENQVANIW